ncbi:MAG: hypothetical protein R2867_14355 [Caldilineaceae bacterium]
MLTNHQKTECQPFVRWLFLLLLVSALHLGHKRYCDQRTATNSIGTVIAKCVRLIALLSTLDAVDLFSLEVPVAQPVLTVDHLRS